MMFFWMHLAAAEPEMRWRLVGAYDTASLRMVEPSSNVDFVWKAADGMLDSCGPAKGPSGLGIFEAEAIASGLSPTLALVLKSDDANAPNLGPQNVRVALSGNNGQILLQPAVSPRNLAIRIEAPEDLKRYTDLVRTQVEMELCMEHKVGRGWLGGETRRVEQAFLLRKPDVANNLDRAYFGGQPDPVPALIGPPDACFLEGASLPESGGKGEGSLELVPSDIWGASLRACGFSEAERAQLVRGQLTKESLRLPLSLSKEPATKAALFDQNLNSKAKSLDAWSLLVVNVHLSEQGVVMVSLDYEGKEALEEPLAPRMSDGKMALIDTLARVPYYYPTLRSPNTNSRYTVLLIPNWQLVEALRRIDFNLIRDTMPEAPRESFDGVNWILAHPDLLSLQVVDETDLQLEQAAPTRLDEFLESIGLSTQTVNTNIQPDLSDPMTGGFLGVLDWGYTLGFSAGRNPIVLPGRTEPTWSQMSSAQRAQHHALFLASGATFLLVVIAGLRRLPELWTPVPEERADYWPGTTNSDDTAELARSVKITPENK